MMLAATLMVISCSPHGMDATLPRCSYMVTHFRREWRVIRKVNHCSMSECYAVYQFRRRVIGGKDGQ